MLLDNKNMASKSQFSFILTQSMLLFSFLFSFIPFTQKNLPKQEKRRRQKMCRCARSCFFFLFFSVFIPFIHQIWINRSHVRRWTEDYADAYDGICADVLIQITELLKHSTNVDSSESQSICCPDVLMWNACKYAVEMCSVVHVVVLWKKWNN